MDSSEEAIAIAKELGQRLLAAGLTMTAADHGGFVIRPGAVAAVVGESKHPGELIVSFCDAHRARNALSAGDGRFLLAGKV